MTTQTHWNYGDKIEAPYVMPDPIKRGEFIHEMRPAKILSFMSPFWKIQRNWGWLGDAYVQFEDGAKAFVPLQPKGV